MSVHYQRLRSYRTGGKLLRYTGWSLYGLLAFMTALLLSWLCLSKVDFLYPLWYEVISIDQTIAKFGPRNRHRSYFEQTTKREHVRLFSAINESIHQSGEGLETLIYQDPMGRPINHLLTPPEIVHLKDVARLVSVMLPVGWATFGVWLLTSVVLMFLKYKIPSLKRLVSTGLISLAIGTVIVVMIGAKKLFYQLHDWIFPPGHPWFFYYEDSLMTTMMKAPDLFGYIAGAWVLLAALTWTSLIFIVQQLQQRKLRH